MNTIKNKIIVLVAMLMLATSAAVATPSVSNETDASSQQQISKQVRHELVTLPYYGIFDNLAYKIDGSTVTLLGQVVRPSTSKDAERRVAKIAGVSQVINNIEVLPLSPSDDDLRLQTYRAIFRSAGLYRYSMGTNPSLHIIVNHGHITLEGVVGTTGDKQLAYFAARGVPGAFSVTNNLRAERGGRKAY